jgi:hypothetical protein
MDETWTQSIFEARHSLCSMNRVVNTGRSFSGVSISKMASRTLRNRARKSIWRIHVLMLTVHWRRVTDMLYLQQNSGPGCFSMYYQLSLQRIILFGNLGVRKETSACCCRYLALLGAAIESQTRSISVAADGRTRRGSEKTRIHEQTRTGLLRWQVIRCCSE